MWLLFFLLSSAVLLDGVGEIMEICANMQSLDEVAWGSFATQLEMVYIFLFSWLEKLQLKIDPPFTLLNRADARIMGRFLD